MKKMIKSIVCVSSLVLLMNVCLYSFLYKRLLPYYWGSNEIADKRTYLTQSHNIYNSIFLGSSKTHNQIVPLLFDKRAKEKGWDIRSYNFGVSGLTPLESLHIYENLLVQDTLRFKYAFIELDWIATINYQNLNATRSFYWLSGSNYLWSLNSVLNSSMPLERRAWGLFHYSLDYMENLMNVGKVHEYISYKKHSSQQSFSDSDSIIVYNGFNPIQRNLTTAEQGLYDEVFAAARMGIANWNKLKAEKLSSPYLARLKEIISLSQRRGIKIYFIVPLQWKHYQYQELIPIINAIEGAKVICLFDVDKYKDIYRPAFFADPNHLNSEGAMLYTEQLFKNFELLENDH